MLIYELNPFLNASLCLVLPLKYLDNVIPTPDMYSKNFSKKRPNKKNIEIKVILNNIIFKNL